MRATIPVLLALPFLAGFPACSTISAVDRPELARASAALRQPCEDPVRLPDRDLATAETGRLWAADRVALADCRDRHGALVGALETIEGQGR